MSKLKVTEKEFHLNMGEKFKKKYEQLIVNVHTIKLQNVVPLKLRFSLAKYVINLSRRSKNTSGDTAQMTRSKYLYSATLAKRGPAKI